MKKGTFFTIQIIWSFILASLVWYLSLKNAAFDFYGNSDNTLFCMFLFGGAAIYLVLTIIYMVIGYKKVKDWKVWMFLMSILICVVCGCLGAAGAIYGSEWIHKLFIA